MTAELKMPRRSEACSACGHTFAVGETLQASLYDTPQGYERRDLCEACAAAQPAADVLAAWKTTRPVAAAHRPPVDREAIFAFFQHLADDEAPARRQFRFVLALLLWRKRVLRFDGAAADADGERWQFSTPRGNQTYSIVRPELAEDELDQLSEQLERVLVGGELPIAADSAAEEAARD